MIDNPCKDCPHRHEACAVDCPQWAEYLEKRQKVYDKRKTDWFAYYKKPRKPKKNFRHEFIED